MRNPTPLRWIEQAEAREVLAVAALERAPSRSRRARVGAAVAEGLERLRCWLAPAGFFADPAMQAQPALIRRPAARRDCRDDDCGLRRW